LKFVRWNQFACRQIIRAVIAVFIGSVRRIASFLQNHSVRIQQMGKIARVSLSAEYLSRFLDWIVSYRCSFLFRFDWGGSPVCLLASMNGCFHSLPLLRDVALPGFNLCPEFCRNFIRNSRGFVPNLTRLRVHRPSALIYPIPQLAA
jgi:hypothetical protein